MTGSSVGDPIPLPSVTSLHRAVLRLLVVPLLVSAAWLTEIFLLEGSRSLFSNPEPLQLAVYTVISCILTGMVVPVLILRRSFLSGAANMFQIGFRSLRRTVVVCTLTGIACYSVAYILTSGSGPAMLAPLFLLYLPTGIAAVMVCWVLVGTHVQALVRAGGAVVSIPTGVVVTAVIFGLTSRVHTPVPGLQDPLAAGILLGMVCALFFFAVRDVYATAVVVTTGMTLLLSGKPVPEVFLPGVVLSALLALLALMAIHGYFLQNYAMVIVARDS